MRSAIFLEGSLKRHIFNQAVPSVISLITTFSFALADTFFIAKLGAEQLAAISFIFPIMEWVVGIGLGIGIATTTRVGQALGGHKFQTAGRFASAALTGAVLLGFLLVLIGFFSLHPLFTILGAKPQVLPYIDRFMTVWYWNIPLIMIYFVAGFTLRSHGFAKLTAFYAIAISLLNLALDPLLIFGFWGFPRLGMTGAAWAALISRIVVLTLAFVVIYQKGVFTPIKGVRRLLNYWTRLLKIALPALMTNLIPPISITLTTVLLSFVSLNAVAGYGIASKIQMLAMIPLLSTSGAISPIVAQNYGAKRLDRSFNVLTLAAKFSLIWGIFIFGILALFAKTITTNFTTTSDIAIVCENFLYIVPISFAGWGIVMMINSTFNAMGKPLYSTLISFARLIVVFIPLAILLLHVMNYKGIFIALTLSNIIVAALAWWLSKKIFNRLKGIKG